MLPKLRRSERSEVRAEDSEICKGIAGEKRVPELFRPVQYVPFQKADYGSD